MNCPKCGNSVADRRNRCEMCGKDLTIYRRTSRLSNSYYNRGLEKAKVRDLTGAIIMLKKSLEMNKRNTNARNLLGLVFFESGETVAALSEWVISKHFQTNNNDADIYMNTISENPTKLDALNQAIKKYNIALESAKQGSDDLAIIQLKKVIQLNTHFIRALQLLALLYMKNNEFERAQKCLVRASRIDLTNTTTLRYQSELNQMISGGAKEPAPLWSDGDKPESLKAMSPISSYREEKPNVWLFINLILGVIIGIAVVFVLVVPTVRQSAASKYEQEARDYSSEISALTAKLTSAQKDVDNLNKKLGDKQKELDSIVIPEYNREMYNNLIFALNRYVDLKVDSGSAIEVEMADEEVIEMAQLLSQINEDQMELGQAKDLCEKLRTEIYPTAATLTFDLGKAAVEEENYEEALVLLEQSDLYRADNPGTLYYLGKANQGLSRPEDAKVYYQRIIDDFPESSYVRYARIRIDEL